ncbi:MAG TPA: FMN-binding glutamate synthase family protein, partial [Ruminococcaceae bacterium]|nr:FMN-binding glutamate synthase family protein [Oscillospiraceae bacterium]
MGINYNVPEYEVVRDPQRCIACRVCERQCANEVHSYDPKTGKMKSDESKCVNCHRCVALCPTHALKIVKNNDTYRINAQWSNEAIGEIYRQAETGGMLLSSMGNPKPYPIYWDKMLLNASQVTNPSIDPLREPMETKTFLGKKPDHIER